MSLKKWAYFYLSPGFSPETNTTKSANDACEFIAVGFDFTQKEKSLQVAQALLNDGVQMIELCGGFGPIWIAKISEHLIHKIPIGSVAYGPEARQPMLDLLKPD